MQEFNINSPFYKGFSISSHRPLTDVIREFCPKCSTNSKYFCYNCMRLMPSISRDDVPKVSFPKDILIWKHPSESIAKSTCVHAFILSDNSKINLFQHHPTFGHPSDLRANIKHPESTIILYPAENATLAEDVDVCSYTTVIFLEATWNQSNTMYSKLKAEFPHIRVAQLRKQKTNYSEGTNFWRYQQNGDFYLSTIEAIYLFCKQIDPKTNYDNLLYFFTFFFHLIQDHYANTDRPFSSKHRLGQAYINK